MCAAPQKASNPRFTECFLRPSVFPTVGRPPGAAAATSQEGPHNAKAPGVERSSIATPTCGLGLVYRRARPQGRSHPGPGTGRGQVRPPGDRRDARSAALRVAGGAGEPTEGTVFRPRTWTKRLTRGRSPRVRPLAAAFRAMACAGPAFASRGCPEHHPAPAVRLKDVVYRTDTLQEGAPNIISARGPSERRGLPDGHVDGDAPFLKMT